MGIPLSPVLANLIIDDLVPKSTEGFQLTIMKVYVDDILICVNKNQADALFFKFNNYHPLL